MTRCITSHTAPIINTHTHTLWGARSSGATPGMQTKHPETRHTEESKVKRHEQLFMSSYSTTSIRSEFQRLHYCLAPLKNGPRASVVLIRLLAQMAAERAAGTLVMVLLVSVDGDSGRMKGSPLKSEHRAADFWCSCSCAIFWQWASGKVIKVICSHAETQQSIWWEFLVGDDTLALPDSSFISSFVGYLGGAGLSVMVLYRKLFQMTEHTTTDIKDLLAYSIIRIKHPWW